MNEHSGQQALKILKEKKMAEFLRLCLVKDFNAIITLPQLFLFLFISTQIVLLGLNNLLMMTSLPSMSSEALTEGLQFLIGALAQAEKKPPLAVADEASTNAFVPFDFISHALLNMPVEQLKYWLARLVLRSSTDDSATVRHNTGLLRKFVEMLTKEAE